MTNPVFPVGSMTSKEDSKMFSVESEDVSMRTPMDGGYVVSRVKHTRAPRKTFKTGFTSIKSADKAILQNFYDNVVKGGSLVFDWTDPSTASSVTPVVYTVRFVGPLLFTYVGLGGSQLWTTSITLEQV